MSYTFHIIWKALGVACYCFGKQERKSKTIKMLTNSVCSRWAPERGRRASCELLDVSSSFVAILLTRNQVRSFSYKMVSSIQTLKNMGVRPKSSLHDCCIQKAYCTIVAYKNMLHPKANCTNVASKKLVSRMLHTRSLGCKFYAY